MKIAELQSASKPLSPEQARVRAMKHNIDRQKEALAQERERQHDAKHAQKIQSLGNRPLEPKALEVEFFPLEEVLHEEIKIY